MKTPEEITQLKYNDLISFAKSIDIRFNFQSKKVLLNLVLLKVEKINNEINELIDATFKDFNTNACMNKIKNVVVFVFLNHDEKKIV